MNTLEKTFISWTIGWIAGATVMTLNGDAWQVFVWAVIIGGTSCFIAIKLTGAK